MIELVQLLRHRFRLVPCFCLFYFVWSINVFLQHQAVLSCLDLRCDDKLLPSFFSISILQFLAYFPPELPSLSLEIAIGSESCWNFSKWSSNWRISWTSLLDCVSTQSPGRCESACWTGIALRLLFDESVLLLRVESIYLFSLGVGWIPVGISTHRRR